MWGTDPAAPQFRWITTLMTREFSFPDVRKYTDKHQPAHAHALV